MRESAEYAVTLTFKVKTVVSFAEMERPSPITDRDAIANAYGSTFALDNFVEDLYNDGFAVEVTEEAERL